MFVDPSLVLSQLHQLDTICDVFLDSVCKYFIKNHYILFIRNGGLWISFCVGSLCGFGSREIMTSLVLGLTFIGCLFNWLVVLITT